MDCLWIHVAINLPLTEAIVAPGLPEDGYGMLLAFAVLKRTGLVTDADLATLPDSAMAGGSLGALSYLSGVPIKNLRGSQKGKQLAQYVLQLVKFEIKI